LSLAQGSTPLEFAIGSYHNRPVVFERLIERGADVRAKNKARSQWPMHPVDIHEPQTVHVHSPDIPSLFTPRLVPNKLVHFDERLSLESFLIGV
jgi:hypothetical protein